MSDGYIKLWRKALESDWLRNPKLWTFWSYCLLKATYKPCTVIIGCQQVQLAPGQFISGRKKAEEEIGLSEQEVRTCKAFLEKAGNITSKPTNKYSIITIVKWADYQTEADASTSRPTNQQPTTNHIQESKEGKEEKKGLSDLLKKYTGEERTLIDQVLQAIAATRKKGKIADSVKAAILLRFDKYERQQVIAGCRTYLDKKYHREGKPEKYLFGIIRNSAAQPAPGFKSTGSKLLDEHYRNQQQTGQGAA